LPGPLAVLGDGPLADALRDLAAQAGLALADAPEQAAVLVVAGLGPLEVRRLGLRDALMKAGPSTTIVANCFPYTVTETTSTLRQISRVAGFSLLGDPRETRLVEVAGGLDTDPGAVQTALALFGALGKAPVAIGDGPGGIFGRVVSSLANEAAAALDDAIATAADIDTAMKLGVNYPYGPLEWADRLGLDVVLQTMRVLNAEYGDRSRPAVRLRRLLQSGRLGGPSGAGFFG
jgi:3-hydroxybutyryl-CoA dehydrogenase